jgi:hypothetical protein
MKEYVVIIQIILQIFCLCLSIVAYNRSKDQLFWLWFFGGFSLQLLRRVFYFFILTMGTSLKFFTFIVIPTGVSICYAIAMFLVYQYIKRTSALLQYHMQLIKQEENRLQDK